MSPKVTAAGIAALLSSLLVTLILTTVPGIKNLPGGADVVISVAGSVVTFGTTVAAGWLRDAEIWAQRYVGGKASARVDTLP